MISTESDIPVTTEVYVLSIPMLREKLDPVSFYTFLSFDLNARAHADHFAEDFEIHIKRISNSGTYVELHSLVTSECLEWIHVESTGIHIE